MSIYSRSFFQGIARIFSLPRLSLPLIITLGLTLGAVLSVVAIVSVLLFKPLPGIKDETNLHSITMELTVSDSLNVSYLNWSRMADFQQKFADVGTWGAIRADDSQVVINDTSYPVTYYDASSSILEVLGTRLLMGQGTDAAAPEEKVWISNSLWQQAFSGRDSAIGKQILVQDKGYVVAGIIEDISAVKSKDTILPQQIWLITDPATMLAEPESGNIDGSVTSLLLRTSGPQPSEGEMRAWFEHFLVSTSPSPQYQEFIRSMPLNIDTVSYRDSIVSGSETLVQMLFVAVIGLLSMASLNLLNLFIAHYQSRSKEFAIQISLGASLLRLRWMIILENLPSFAMAAALGLLASGWALRGLPVIAGDVLPLLEMVAVDGFSVFIALMLVLLLTVVFSLLALMDVSKQALSQALNGSGKGVQAQTNHNLSRGLMVLQLSLASILLTASVMLAKQSFDAVYQPLGYKLNNAYSLSWAYGDELWAEKLEEFDDYAGSEYQQLHKDLSRALERLLPGSEVVTTSSAPLSSRFNVRPLMDPAIAEQFLFQTKDLSHNAFSAFDIEFLAGQAPTLTQIEANERFIVIDERMAEAAFADKSLQQILGQALTIGIDDNAQTLPIIGIVQNTLSRVGSLDNMAFPTVYAIQTGNGQRLHLSVLMPEGQSLDESLIAAELDSQFPRLIDLQVQSLAERWDEQTLTQRISLAVILAMTGLTLFLAIIGVAGLTQMTTNQKRYELAVRMATGAKRSRLLQLVFREAMWMLVVGLSLGFVISVLGYTELKQSVSMMPDFDWQSMLLLDGGLIAVVALAVTLPAWRIIRADPMQALREL